MCEVSVIIPYYNRESTIERALNSVVEQSYKDYEIILIDDGSSDNSHEIVDDFIKKRKEYKIINLYQDNSGPSKARNRGIEEAKGEYIAFLDSDDSWVPNKLEIQMNFLQKNKEVMILGTDYNNIINGNISTKSSNTNKYKEVGFYKRLIKCYFPTSTVVIKREVFEEFRFNEEQKYAEDTLLFLKILRKYPGGKIELPLVNYYKLEYGAGGLSSRLKEVEMWELKNFKTLREENKFNNKKINFVFYIFLICFSYLKYMRRIVIVKIRST